MHYLLHVLKTLAQYHDIILHTGNRLLKIKDF